MWLNRQLHLGCGGRHLAGWINADAVAAPGVDVVLELPKDLAKIPTAALTWVYSSHVIEHIAPDLLPQVLGELHRVLKPGARLTLATIDLDGIYNNAYRKGYTALAWNSYLYGDTKSTDPPFMAHRQCFTAASLTEQLQAAGFSVVRPWALAMYPEIHALNDCARSSYHVTLYLEALR